MTLDFARKLIEEETGLPFASAAGKPVEAGSTSQAEAIDEQESEGKRLVARDEKNNPLFSAWDWTAEATARILRVPAGFMRDRTQERVEELAREQGSRQIDLERVEAGIEFGLQTMAEMVSQHREDSDAERQTEPPAAAQCPAVQKRDSESRGPAGEAPLNEVAPITELAAVRLLLTKEETAGDR